MGFFLLVFNFILVAPFIIAFIIAARSGAAGTAQRPFSGVGPIPEPGELKVVSPQPEKIKRLVPEIYSLGGPVRAISAKSPQRVVLHFALNVQHGQAAVLLERPLQETILFGFDHQSLSRVLFDSRSVSISRVRGPTREKAGLLFQRLNSLALSAANEAPGGTS